MVRLRRYYVMYHWKINIRSVQGNNLGTSIGATRVDVLDFAGDQDLKADRKKIRSKNYKHTHRKS